MGNGADPAKPLRCLSYTHAAETAQPGIWGTTMAYVLPYQHDRTEGGSRLALGIGHTRWERKNGMPCVRQS